MQYRVYMETTISYSVTVEADSAEEAEEKVLTEGAPDICGYCSLSQGLDMASEWEVIDTDQIDE